MQHLVFHSRQDITTNHKHLGLRKFTKMSTLNYLWDSIQYISLPKTIISKDICIACFFLFLIYHHHEINITEDLFYSRQVWKRRKQWQSTPVLLPGKSHGRRSLEGCSPWGHQESDTTERLHFHFHALEKEMITHSSILAWRIPRMGEPGGLPSMGSHRVG